jgi:hypothetical protein
MEKWKNILISIVLLIIVFIGIYIYFNITNPIPEPPCNNYKLCTEYRNNEIECLTVNCKELKEFNCTPDLTMCSNSKYKYSVTELI